MGKPGNVLDPVPMIDELGGREKEGAASPSPATDTECHVQDRPSDAFRILRASEARRQRRTMRKTASPTMRTARVSGSPGIDDEERRPWRGAIVTSAVLAAQNQDHAGEQPAGPRHHRAIGHPDNAKTIR